jgi:hypothetical protein
VDGGRSLVYPVNGIVGEEICNESGLNFYGVENAPVVLNYGSDDEAYEHGVLLITAPLSMLPGAHDGGSRFVSWAAYY